MRRVPLLLGIFALLAGFQDPKGVDIRLRTEAARRGKEWRLKMTGATRKLPDGVIVTLRIYRVVPRIRWMNKSIRMERIDIPVIRKVYANGNKFERTEKFDSPGRLEVEVAFDPKDQEDPRLPEKMKRNYRPWQKTFALRAADAADLVPALEKDAGRLRELLTEAGKLLQSISELMDDPDALQEESPKKMKELDKQLIETRKFAKTSSLHGSATLLTTLLADVYNTLGTGLSKEKPPKKDGQDPPDESSAHEGGKGAATSSLTGKGFSLKDAQNYVRDILEVSRRETGYMILLEAEALVSDLDAAWREFREKETSAWDRRRRQIEKSIEALEKFDRKLRADDAYPKAVDRKKTRERLSDVLAECAGMIGTVHESLRGTGTLKDEELKTRLGEFAGALGGFRKHLELPESE